MCQCIVDNEYQETLPFDDELDESLCLEPQPSTHTGRNTLVLDLDETLVHSSLRPDSKVDFILQFLTEATPSSIYVQKRPGLDVEGRVCRGRGNCGHGAAAGEALCHGQPCPVLLALFRSS